MILHAHRNVLAVAVALMLLVVGCARDQRPHRGMFVLRWMERPGAGGPSTEADAADVVHFKKVMSFDAGAGRDFNQVRPLLREGDVIAYRMTRRDVRRSLYRGQLQRAGYGLFTYGHMGIIVGEVDADAAEAGAARIFSSHSFVGVNRREGLDTLAEHNWDAYRLDQWERVDRARLHEFVGLVEERAGHWRGYDFSGMFGLWNSNLRPARPGEIGNDYICSTVVLAALYYAGIELDAVRNNGYLDICTPLQVVSSAGRIVPAEARLEVSERPTRRMVPLRRAAQ